MTRISPPSNEAPGNGNPPSVPPPPDEPDDMRAVWMIIGWMVLMGLVGFTVLAISIAADWN